MPALVLALVLGAAIGAAAQEQPVDPPVRRAEVSIGGGWIGGVDLGRADANLRANHPTPQPFRLFSADETLASAPAFTITAGYNVTRRWGFEAGVAISRPELRADVSADAEGAAAMTAVERVDQYFIEGRIVVSLEALGIGRRTIPFATAGVGYLRHRHEGRTVIEQGHGYHVGGGLKHWLFVRDEGFIRGVGVRVDGRWYLLSGGIERDSGYKARATLLAAGVLGL